MNNTVDLVVFIGRFEPFHAGHKEVLDFALTMSDDVIVLVGSSFQPRTIKNPWFFEDRKRMIELVYPEETKPRLSSNFFDSPRKLVTIKPLQDYRPDNNVWASQVQQIVQDRLRALPWKNTPYVVRIIGCDKDETSFYLDLFPQWDPIKCPLNLVIHAADIRANMFEERNMLNAKVTSPEVYQFLKDFMLTNEFYNLKDEWEFIKDYKRQWAGAPYAVNFQTADAVVIQSGYVLLVQRRATPGRGLWALPGGFVNVNESIRAAAYRELKEETKIDVPLKVLQGCEVGSKTFDDPQRSLRGRTITKAFCIKLPAGRLPKVKGSDDALKAMWVPLSDVREDQMFDDHYQIIQSFVGRFSGNPQASWEVTKNG